MMTPRKPSPYNRDQIDLFTRIVKLSADNDERFVKVRTVLAVRIVEMLKDVRKPRGRQRISGRDRITEDMVIHRARARKAELIAAGTAKGKAADKAAEEAAAKLRATRLLSVTTIKRRMQRRQ